MARTYQALCPRRPITTIRPGMKIRREEMEGVKRGRTYEVISVGKKTAMIAWRSLGKRRCEIMSQRDIRQYFEEVE